MHTFFALKNLNLRGGWTEKYMVSHNKNTILSVMTRFILLSTAEMKQCLYPNLALKKNSSGLNLFHTHSFALGQGHLVGLFGQILSSNQHTDLLRPIRARLLPAAVDGLSDGQRHAKWD